MQFNWSTFILEIINFIVLVWVLKRLLYIPVKQAILQRKQAIQGMLDKAEKLKTDAQSLENKYENRLAEWEKEKEEKRKALQQEMAELKSKKLAELDQAMMKEKDKINAREQRRLQAQMENNLRQSMLLAAKFSTKFLKNFADVALEKKIIDAFSEDLLHLPATQLQQLKKEIENQIIMQIQSAFPLDEQQKQIIEKNFSTILEKKININFSQNAELLSGVTVQIGAIVMQASLRDELKFFAEVASGPIQ